MENAIMAWWMGAGEDDKTGDEGDGGGGGGGDAGSGGGGADQ